MAKLNLQQPHEFAVYDRIRALFYGGPGVGKSTLGLSAPRPLHVDCDNGVHRVNERHHKTRMFPENWEQILDIIDSEDMVDFDTVVMDTIGKMMLYMNEYLGRKNPRYVQFDGTLTQKAYGVRKEMFRDFLNKISRMGKHLIFIAHDKEGRKGENGSLFYRPDVGGSSEQDLIRELDLVGYLSVIGGQRILSCDPAENSYGKNTIDLPASLPLKNPLTGPNNQLTEILATFSANVERRKAVSMEYRKMISVAEAEIEAISTVEDANRVYTSFRAATVKIWDSYDICCKMAWDAIIAKGYKPNPKTKQFDAAVVATVAEPDPAKATAPADIPAGEKGPANAGAGQPPTGSTPSIDV